VSSAISHVDASRFGEALLAGIANVFRHREAINRINVFPVADSDTGTNLVFTLASVRRVIEQQPGTSLPELLGHIAEAALDGARGNSGAILAQYFQGLSESSRGYQVFDGARLASASAAGAQSAWQAMSDPVPGTLPTVLEDFADELTRRVRDGVDDIRALLRYGLQRARQSLAGTPDLLPILRDAGVVDAGAQGFVDLLEGVWRYTRSGRVPASTEAVASTVPELPTQKMPAPDGHRYCTECLVDGDQMPVGQLRRELESLSADSLVVAGSDRRVRVHIHTNTPGEVFRICARFGEIRQQKADDMRRQHRLMSQRGRVAIVTDSAADLPPEEAERLGIHIIPIRLNFGQEEFLDKLTMTPAAFYRRLGQPGRHPQTSQPPPADFRRQFELLVSHQLEVIGLHISGRLSGTLQAARQAAERVDAGRIAVFDTRNAACGQGLMVLWAAEAAARGWERVAIAAWLTEHRHEFRTFALARDLSWGVRGGRVRPWMETIARRLRLNPILTASKEGDLAARAVIPGRTKALERFCRYVLRRMNSGTVYRVVISHTDAARDARQLRDRLLAAHTEIDACWIVEASPAVGAHAGPGTLIVGLHPWQPPEAHDD